MYMPEFRNKPVLGILRGIGEELIEPVIETVLASGLETMEITMNTPRAPDLIRRAKKVCGGRLHLGAGTVLTVDDLKAAVQGGAGFIVTPVLASEVLGYCLKNKIPVFAGAFSPGEIYRAYQEGAEMVKVFPAGILGPGYFRQLKGPFKDIELLACGGVTAENLKEYFACGASAVSFGASVFRKDWLAAGDFKSIGQAVKNFIEAWRKQG